mgnify:CR=1 FL=1
MPELPEVEAARALIQRVARGRRITSVQCAPDPLVFEGVSPARFARALRGRRVTAVRRHGKHLWLELDRRPWPIFHFGMTGGFHAPAGGGVRLILGGRLALALGALDGVRVVPVGRHLELGLIQLGAVCVAHAVRDLGATGAARRQVRRGDKRRP